MRSRSQPGADADAVTVAITTVRKHIMKTHSLLVLTGALACVTIAAPTHAARKNTPVDSKGRDCIAFIESARLQETNQGMYEHVVTAMNQCERTIYLNICYRGSTECSAITVDAGADVRTALGTKFMQPYFAIQWTLGDGPPVRQLSD